MVLHNASCPSCAGTINSEIETPTLKFLWLDARTHLGLPTSSPQTHLKVGTWDGEGLDLPESMPDANFKFERLPVGDHPFIATQPLLEQPGILSGREPSEGFTIHAIQAYFGGKLPVDAPGRKAGIVQPYKHDTHCRMIAKIAHGAAVAELGLGAFEPFLPDLIMGRSKFYSHYVGSSWRRGRKRESLHEIALELTQGFLVAHVTMFAELGFRPYLVIVGKPSSELSKWHMSASRSHSTAPQ